MNIPAMTLIKAYHGYAYETAGFISAFFRDARDARNCARRLSRFVDGLGIFGTQLTFRSHTLPHPTA